MLGSIFLADKYHKKIESCFVLTFLYTMLGVYLASFIGILEISVWIIGIFWILAGAYTMGKHLKKKDTFFQEQIVTNGLLLFTILFFVLLTFSFSKMLTNWDQYSYWSIHTKNAFYYNNWIVDVGIQYPPVPTTIQYFFMKIAGEYRQGIEAFSMQVLVFTCLFPFLEWIKGKRVEKIAAIVSIICLPAVFLALNFYDSSYPDTLLGILLGFIWIEFIYEKNKAYKNAVVILGLITLTLTKATGVYLAGIGVMMMLLYEIWLQKKQSISWKQIRKSRAIKMCLVYLLIVLLTIASWKGYQTFYAGELEQASTQNIREEKGNILAYLWNSVTIAIFGYGDEIATTGAQSIGNLLESLYETPALTKPIDISIFSTTILLFGISILLYYKVLKENREILKKTMVLLGVGLVLYTAILQAAYMTVFSTEEMILHSGIDRYLPTFLLTILYCIIAIVFKEKKESKFFYASIIGIFLWITPLQLIANSVLTSGIYEKEKRAEWEPIITQVQEIQEKMEGTTEEVWILSTTENAGQMLYQNAIRYYLYPEIKVKVVNCTQEKQLEQAVEQISQEEKTYVCILETDEKLEKALGEEVEEKTLYAITKQENNILQWEEVE